MNDVPQLEACNAQVNGTGSSSPFLQRPYRLWKAISAWKRAVCLILLACLLIQSEIGRRLWRESVNREQLAEVANFELAPFPFSYSVERPLKWLIGARKELLRPVERVWLPEAEDDGLLIVTKFSSLEELTISFGQVTPGGLATIRSLRHLRSLYLHTEPTLTGGLDGLPSCTNLQRLKLVGKFEAQALEPLEKCFALTELHVDIRDFDAEDFAVANGSLTELHLAAIGRIPNLQRLVIQSESLPDTHLSALSNAGRLQELYVHGLKVNGDSLNSLCHLPYLQKLILIAQEEDSKVQWRPSGFRSLQNLAISGAHVNFDSVAHLTRLQTLSLNSCRIHGELSSVSRMKNLKHLNLFLTDVTTTKLMEMEKHAGLEFMIVGLDMISEAELLKRFPSLKRGQTTNRWQDLEAFPQWSSESSFAPPAGFF